MNYRERILHFYKLARKDGHCPQQARCHAKHNAKYKDSPKLDVFDDAHGYDGENTVALPNGWSLKFEIQRDDDSGAPWKECDGHGVVYERSGREDYMDEWVLNSDRGWYRYYDWKASLKIAKRDRWGCKPYDSSPAMDAVKADYEFLRRWCEDDWWWIGCIVTLYDEHGDELNSESCWGFDSDSMDYVASEARSWAARMIVKTRKAEREARRQERIASRFQDAMRCGV